jgi:hypothetical protein
MTEWKLADVSTVIVGAGFSAAATDGRMPRAVTALVIGNIGKQRDAAAGGPGADGRATGGCCDAHHKPRRPSLRPAARQPTGASSCKYTMTGTSSRDG